LLAKRLLRVAAYSHYLNATITVRYRLGDIVLSATGVFVGDSGRSIFLEQHIEQRGRRNYFRWEIPYANIHSIETENAVETEAAAEKCEQSRPTRASAAAAGASDSRAGAATILPLARPPKTA
jgi:hypothetical protein